MVKEYDLVVIGGGPAGLAASYKASQNGVKNILIIERDEHLGGILNQCIHNGFGLHRFKEELTGPEYASKFIDMVKTTNIEIESDSMVVNIEKNKNVHFVSTKKGYTIVKAKSVILAMGCRERTRGAISIPGDRTSGIFTAGACQKYVNIDGYLVGKRVVILGSGDIGLIMARRMTLEGAKVLAVVELMPYSNGLNRNVVQCLNDFDIPLYLSHTVTNIIGDKRVEKVIVSKVDDKRNPISGTEIEFDCDTLLLSVGLIPENELSKDCGVELDSRTNGPIVYENMETSIPGVFACGNVLHVHDLVDNVSMEAERAGVAASKYILENKELVGEPIIVKNGNLVSYTVPQKIRIDNVEDSVEIFFRVRSVMQNKKIVVESNKEILTSVSRANLAPGEMEHIKLTKEMLSKAVSTIEVRIGE